MAGNFNISVTKTGDHVCLKLNGDFDGSSACELMNLLNGGELFNSSKILVDTDSLKNVHPFGLNILHSRLHKLKSMKVPLIFTGKLSGRFASG
jgi:anti-anti-sigma regulatory factor